VSKRKLLLADDSITIQKVVNLTFADEGIEVISVGDGDSAWEKINEFAPDLVLADVNMPGLNGYQICEKLKQNAATQKIPVILLVGSFEPFDEAEAYRVGADDYLTKPFQSIRQLVSKVSDLLDSANGAETPADEDTEPNIGESTLPNMPFINIKEFAEEDSSNFVQLDDAGMDDEMIQTNQVGSLPVDEAQKFMTDAQWEETNESRAGESLDANFESQRDFKVEDDFGEAQPSLEEDFQPSSFESNRETDKAMVYDYVGETANLNQEAGENQIFSIEQMPETEEVSYETAAPTEARENPVFGNERFSGEVSPPASSNLMFDDMDLLELPSFRQQSSFEGAAAATQTAKSPEPAMFETAEKSASANERVNQFSRLSPEMIETLAQKVAEKISDKMIREIAWELVPQLTATLMKKMSEEKLKE